MTDIEQARAVAVAVARKDHAFASWLDNWCRTCTRGEYDDGEEVRTALAGIRVARGMTIEEALA